MEITVEVLDDNYDLSVSETILNILPFLHGEGNTEIRIEYNGDEIGNVFINRYCDLVGIKKLYKNENYGKCKKFLDKDTNTVLIRCRDGEDDLYVIEVCTNKENCL